MTDKIVKKIFELSEARRGSWSKAGSVDPDEKFVDFLLELEGIHDIEIIAALLRTFDDSLDDGGTQEMVCGLLSTVPRPVFQAALKKEIAGLRKRAPEWRKIVLTI